ncbi:MAG: allantoicase [Arenicellales bacterium]
MNDSTAKRPSFTTLVNLAQPRLGARVIFANDEFFGAKERLIDPAAPVFIPGKYDDHGKWMDGWETRRRREPGHDHCVIRLGSACIVKGFDVDTSHFTGNYAPEVSIEACLSDKRQPAGEDEWWEVVPRAPLRGDSHHFLAAATGPACTHLRVNIHPDGGVARLRVYGEVQPDWDALAAGGTFDLMALENGGRALACSDEHFGSMHNLNAPGRGVNMGDGWETARRRGPGHDWVILALGRAGIIEAIEIDTAHFKGNYPDCASIQAGHTTETDVDRLIAASRSWPLLLRESKLQADRQHVFKRDIDSPGLVSHIRLNIFPDGGVSRLRVFGHLTESE